MGSAVRHETRGRRRQPEAYCCSVGLACDGSLRRRRRLICAGFLVVIYVRGLIAKFSFIYFILGGHDNDILIMI